MSITINSLSGGKTSSYMAIHYPVNYNLFALVCIDDSSCSPKDSKIIQQVNDKLNKYGFIDLYGEFIATAEDDKILKVMFDLEQKLGTEIIWLRDLSFEQHIDLKGMLPNQMMRYCTTELKIIPIAKYVVFNIWKKMEGSPVLMNIGFRMDEPQRAKMGNERKYQSKLIIDNSGVRNKWRTFYWADANYPLISNHIHYFHINNYWKLENIKFPEDSNCVGCFWKQIQQLRKNWDDQPLKMQWFSNQEKRRHHFFKPNINYDQIKNIELRKGFFFGTGSGCNAGFCTD